MERLPRQVSAVGSLDGGPLKPVDLSSQARGPRTRPNRHETTIHMIPLEVLA